MFTATNWQGAEYTRGRVVFSPETVSGITTFLFQNSKFQYLKGMTLRVPLHSCTHSMLIVWHTYLLTNPVFFFYLKAHKVQDVRTLCKNYSIW